ncbi:NB-ARC domain-containing protein [Aerosakkonemataceae cyanobacterium BLCC-F50]|uniref:NB-ARC domain-containing protein n=1 Tax=Floridaenema flaviceps BLCC-F50 TaxID=3153642 RepID=A0ABV4XQW9_9CYAN
MMEFEEGLKVADEAFFISVGRRLTEVEIAILRGSWQGQTYEQISDVSSYSVSYLKRDIGPKLWKLLSEALGEEVSKSNFRPALERKWRSLLTTPIVTDSPVNNPRQDWGEAIDVSIFYGRNPELSTLSQWILQDKCRLICLLGMGGIGKTALSVKLAQQIKDEFDYIIWRSLRNAPPLENLLNELVLFLSNQQDNKAELCRLMQYLRSHRCLVILDNLETILNANRAGYYRSGYENYGELLQVIGETPHSSCVILTSREKPAEIATFEGVELAVRSFRLNGLQAEAEQLFTAKGLFGSDADKQRLIECYGGNPLALKIVSTSIQDLFDGNISEFLAQDTPLFNGVRRLLDQQFSRLSANEQTVMYWLAINREWTTVSELYEDILPPISRAKLLETLEALSWRNLIEKQSGSYTQQPVVMEYVSDRLTESIAEELLTKKLSLFINYALLKTNVKDYIGESQIRLILEPVVNKLSTYLTSKTAVEQLLKQILELLKSHEKGSFGYSCGNLINLFRHLETDLTSYDFSNLEFCQAYLLDVNLHNVNFSNCNFHKSIFNQAFGSIVSVDFSPNGKLVASGDATGELYLWSLDRALNSASNFCQPLLTLKGHSSWVWSIDFSPSGQIIASCGEDQTIRIWDVSTGECLRILQGHTSVILSVSFSPDGQLLATSSGDATVKIWDINTGNCLHTFSGNTNQNRTVAISPNGQLVASGSADQTMRIWDIKTGGLLKVLTGHQGQVWTIDFHPNGKLIASGSHDQTVRIWDVNTGECLKILQGHQGQVWSVAFSPDGKSLASGSGDRTIKIWQVETGQCLKTFRAHTNLIWSVAFSPDGRTIASGSEDQTMKLWDVQTGQLLRCFQGYAIQIWSVCFSPNDEMLASCGTDSTIRIWNYHTGECLKTLQKKYTSWMVCLAFSPNGKIMVSGSADCQIRIWDVNTGECLHNLSGHTSWVTSVAFSPDGQYLATSSMDQTIKIWQVATNKCVKDWQVHTNWIWSVSWSPDGQKLASGSLDKIVKILDANTGECLKTFSGHTNWVWSAVFSPDGKLLASSSSDQTVRIWDINSGEALKVFHGHTNQIFGVRFSPDGKVIASASTDQTVRIWDVDTGECIKVLPGHTNQIRSLAFSVGGNAIASGSADGTIKIWDVQTGECLRTLQAKRPYEGMNITGITGLNEAEKATLKALGAKVYSS